MNTIQPTLFDLTGSVFIPAPESRREVQAPKTPMFCPLVNMALELALLPGKGELVAIYTDDEKYFAFIANHVDDGYVFIVQVIGNEIIGTKHGVRGNGFALNALLEQKFKNSDALVVRKKEKAWNYCHYFYESKKHSLDEYKKMIEGSAGI